MRYGVAISTYIDKKARPNRPVIFLASIHSLLASGFDGKIVIVDDASPDNEHLGRLYGMTDRIQYIKRKENAGIAQCKNDGIRALADCDYLFLADDDMLYNGNWWQLYIDASQKTGIGHFCYYVPQVYHYPRAETVDYRGAVLTRYRELNGCLMFMTRDVISSVGLFRDSPQKHYLEHPSYSMRCLSAGKWPFFCDVQGSRDHLRLNRASYECKSVVGAHKKNEVAEHMAAVYDDLYAKTNYDDPNLTGNPWKWGPLCLAVQSLGPGRKLSVVDLGCGRGYYLRKLFELGHTVFGVEHSAVCCDKYLGDIPHANAGIVRFLTENTRRFDVVMSTDVFEHIAEHEVPDVLARVSKIAEVGLFGITNSSDKSELTNEELHLCIHDVEWWRTQLLKHYGQVVVVPDTRTYRNEYFLLMCRNPKGSAAE